MRKPYPMAELRTLLERKDKEKESCRLLPVLYGITYEECDCLTTEYDCKDWVKGEEKPDADMLVQWASLVERLLCITAKHEAQVSRRAHLCVACIHTTQFQPHNMRLKRPLVTEPMLTEQVGGSECRMALAVRDAVIDELKKAGKLKPYFQPRSQLETPMQLSRIPHPLFGRKDDVQQIKASLEQYRAAVIWGGPGDGKSSVAMEAGCQLWSEQKCPGGCFVVDMLGMAVPAILSA